MTMILNEESIRQFYIAILTGLKKPAKENINGKL
jgi:hypothetical protein